MFSIDRNTLFRLRPFCNTDPPNLVDVWRSQTSNCELLESISVSALEHFVFAKPYFDRNGLILAESDGRVIGFVHAGFGPNQEYSDISFQDGVICMLQVLPGFDASGARGQLFDAAEEYLIGKGAGRIFGGAHPPFIPFYHGLLNFGELSGVPHDDQPMHDMYQARNYWLLREYCIMNCELGSRRAVVDRNQWQLARSYEVRPTLDHAFDNWWESCAFGPVPRSKFELINHAGIPCGSMLWWDLEPSRTTFGPAVAISRVGIDDDRRRSGLATLLVSSALKQLKASGITLAQVSVPTSNEAAMELFRKLGFSEVNRGYAYLKHVDEETTESNVS